MDLCSSKTQRQSEPALTESQAEDSSKDSGFLSELEAETEWSDQVSCEEETCLPSSSRSEASICVPSSSEPSPAGVEGRTSSEFPVSPHPSFAESSVSFSPLSGHCSSEASGEVCSRFEDATDPVPEPQNTQPAPLLRLLPSQSESLESNEALAPMLDLYIFESDFSLSQAVDPLGIPCPEFCPLSQAEEVQLDRGGDACVSMCNSEGIQTQCHCGFSQERAGEGDVSEEDREKELWPLDVNACEGDFISIKTVRSREVDPRCDSPDDLWLDACQYLTDEDADDQKTSYSEMSRGHSALSVPSVPPQVSGFSLDGNKGIGWCSNDNRGWRPPIERWPSADSWASALSDLTGFADTLPEDFTAAFAEVGAEIDALTQALETDKAFEEFERSQEYQEIEQEGAKLSMGVQDQPLKTQSIPGSSIESKQSCLTLCFEAGEPKLHDVFYESVSTTQKSEEILQIEETSGKYSKAEDISSLDASGVIDNDPIRLNITEETDLNVPGELLLEKVCYCLFLHCSSLVKIKCYKQLL